VASRAAAVAVAAAAASGPADPPFWALHRVADNTGLGPERVGDGVSDPTVAVYESRAADWAAQRSARRPERAAALGDGVVDGPVVDLGCGPGWHLPHLGTGAVGLDAARAMLDLAPADHPRVQARLDALPFRRGSLGGAWGSKSYVHLARTAVPLALADLHRALVPDAPVDLTVFGGDTEHESFADDEFPGRRFSGWPVPMLRDVLVGAGFAVEDLTVVSGVDLVPQLLCRLRRDRTLPDTVGPGMRLLVCGLNPSVLSADIGVGFARPGNRYWPAALAAGLVSRDRDTRHALVHHGIGMTDLVKRATPRADALTTDEYRDGVGRVGRLVEWLQPGAVVMVGLAGWRATVDRKAVAGLQDEPFGGRPVYVMPSTSGLNASSRLEDLTAHLAAAATLA